MPKNFLPFLHEKYRLFNIVVLIQQCHNGKHTSRKKNATDEDVIAVAKLAKFDKFVHNCLSKKSCGEQSPQLFYKNNLLNDNFLTIGTDIQPTALPSTAHKKYTAACDALAHLLIKK